MRKKLYLLAAAIILTGISCVLLGIVVVFSPLDNDLEVVLSIIGVLTSSVAMSIFIVMLINIMIEFIQKLISNKRMPKYYLGEDVFDTSIDYIDEDGQIGYGSYGRQILDCDGEVVGFQAEDPADSYGYQIDGTYIQFRDYNE